MPQYGLSALLLTVWLAAVVLASTREQSGRFGLSSLMWTVAAFACLFAILRSPSATMAAAIGIAFLAWTGLIIAAALTERRVITLLLIFTSGLMFGGLAAAVLLSIW